LDCFVIFVPVTLNTYNFSPWFIRSLFYLAEEEVELRREAKTTFRKMPRNSLRSLSLNRRPEALARTAAATVFRSPSIYDEPRPFPVEEVQLSFSLKIPFHFYKGSE
jgi:hypothetical protein